MVPCVTCRSELGHDSSSIADTSRVVPLWTRLVAPGVRWRIALGRDSFGLSVGQPLVRGVCVSDSEVCVSDREVCVSGCACESLCDVPSDPCKCGCVCVCVCVFVCVCECVSELMSHFAMFSSLPTCVCVRVCVDLCTRLYVGVNMCVCACVFFGVCACARVFAYAYVCVFVCVRVYVCVRRVHVYMCESMFVRV